MKHWLSDDSMEPNKNPLLMRTFFRGEMPIEDNIRFFQAVQAYAIRFLKEMEKPPVSAGIYAKEIKEPEQAIYWEMTIEYGMMHMDMLRRWSEACITRLEHLTKEHSGDDGMCRKETEAL